MTTQQTPLVVGIFEHENQAKLALDGLRQAGFSHDQIGVARHVANTAVVNLHDELANLGVPHEEASYYHRAYEAGYTVISVRADGREAEAESILRSCGASLYQQGTGTAQTTGTTGQVLNETEEQRSLRLREERLEASKERVQTGEVRLHKEVVSEEKSITVPVTHEEIVIERHRVPEGQTDATPIGEGETIRIPVSEEQVQVTKTPVVTGEVSIGKQAIQETKQITDTVKREEAHITHTGDVSIHDSGSTES